MHRGAQSIVDNVSELIGRLSVVPDQLTVTGRMEGPALVFRICANIADSKRIVGRQGSTLAALKDMALLMSDEVFPGLPIDFMRVEATDAPEAGMMRTDPASFVLEDELARFGTYVTWCFSGSKIVLDVRNEHDAVRFIATVHSDEQQRITQCARALHVLMVLIGRKAGKTIYASVEAPSGGCDEADHAARRGVRYSGPIPCEKPQQRQPSLPR